MGINLGAFLSPLVCGWLTENTVGGFHSGFTMAGIGMVLGLGIYLVGQPFIRELPPDAMIPPTPPYASAAAPLQGTEIRAEEMLAPPPLSGAALTEAQAERAPSVLGAAAALVPGFLYLVGGLFFGLALVLIGVILFAPTLAESLGSLQEYVGGPDASNISNKVMLAITGFCLILMGYVASKSPGGMRDRVLSILVLGIFVVFFWAAFEQAGNVLNVWADQTTNRYIWKTPPKVDPNVAAVEAEDKAKQEEELPGPEGPWQHFLHLFPNMVKLKAQPGAEAPEKTWGETLSGWFNPMPTAWFQSINALAIFTIAPIFAWLWVFLDRKGWQPSIPLKMALGLVAMSASMAVMLAAAKEENRLTEVPWGKALPAGISVTDMHQLAHGKAGHLEPFHAGRLTEDGKSLVIYGVLDKNECDLLIEKTAPESYEKKVEELKKKSADIDGDKVKSVEVELDAVPPGFEKGLPGLKKSMVEFQEKDGKAKLIARARLVQKEVKGLLVSGGEQDFRTTIRKLYSDSTEFRVSSWWLFWSYILATLGELCLSPVGLSMVSKLAPAKFATMLMGVWLLTGAFGNFAAGAMGEVWGTIPPTDFFLWAVAIVGGSAIVLFVLVRGLTSAMHGVK